MRARPVQRTSSLRGSALFGGPRSLRAGYRTTLGPRGRTLGAFGDVGQVAWPASVEQWRDLVTRYAGGIPVEFLLAWIKVESGGNPCDYTWLRESGIFQLMYPDNLAQAGVTEDALRTACDPAQAQQCISYRSDCNAQPIRPLTDDESTLQVTSGIQYVNACRAYVDRFVNWSTRSADYWKMVKMVHVLPSPVAKFASSSANWDDFYQKARAGGTPASFLDNAATVGAYGEGGGGILGTGIPNPISAVQNLGPAGWLAIGGIALAGALVYRQRKHGGRLIPV